MDPYQFIVPTGLYVRLAIELVVAMLLSGWLIAHWRRGWSSIVGSLAALAWAVEVAALTFGYSVYDDSAPGWARWIIDHSESLDWLRVVALTVTVVALVLLSRVPRRT